ncbi:hypothetical protein XELAEV_180391904mg, partial [Xenopus laevis]
DRDKLRSSYAVEPWMENLNSYEDPINTE